ncbi:MAG: hypothetical protein KJS67_00380 [Actinomycetales bacterium]|nr:hypothetical protein [Actinomycetales bacterium]
MEENQSPLETVADIKKRIAEISFAPLSEHGEKFEGINSELSSALQSVEGLSN